MFHEYLMLASEDTNKKGWTTTTASLFNSCNDDGTINAFGDPADGSNGTVRIGNLSGGGTYATTISAPTAPTYTDFTLVSGSGEFGKHVMIDKAGAVLMVNCLWRYTGTGAQTGKKLNINNCYVYTRSGTTWSLNHTFTTTTTSWRVGCCLSGDGKIIALYQATVPLPAVSDVSPTAMVVEIYEDVAGTWTLRDTISAENTWPISGQAGSSFIIGNQLRLSETGSVLFRMGSGETIDVLNRSGNAWTVSNTIDDGGGDTINFGRQMVCSDDGTRLFVKFSRTGGVNATDYNRPYYFDIFDYGGSPATWTKTATVDMEVVDYQGDYYYTPQFVVAPVKIDCSGDGSVLWVGTSGFDSPVFKYDCTGSPIVLSAKLYTGPHTDIVDTLGFHSASSGYAQSNIACTNDGRYTIIYGLQADSNNLSETIV